MSFDRLKRRDFITLVGGAVAAWPLAARAQQPTPAIGYFSGRSAASDRSMVAAFRDGLSATGYVEGKNVAIEFRWADGQPERLPSLADDLARRRVSVIVTSGSELTTRAAMAATQDIPIVFTVGGDPVRSGLVPSLNRPGGNLTGVTTLDVEVAPKRLELMHELILSTSTVAVLINPDRLTAAAITRDLDAAARTLGRRIHVLHASNEREINAAFADVVQLRAGALVIGNSTYYNTRAEQLGLLAAQNAVATIYQFREFVAAGGLLSYGSSITEAYRISGNYAGRILKGEKPGGLPVQQATKVELIINMKTAKALGLEVPPQLLARADEVIE
jgi:putative tryptophan/tyrosine transport system substrate-binding protein